MSEKVERTCPACSVNYLADAGRLKFGRQTTCSRACSYRLRADQIKASLDLVCALCETQFQRVPSHVKGKHGSQFCSRECHYAARAVGLTKRVVTKPYQYTEEGRRILSAAGARAYARGETLAYPETERATAQRLEELGVPFVHQQFFATPWGGIVADFYFPARALVIELDSDQAHRRSREADAKRDEFLASLGITVRRIKDTGDVAEARRAVLRALA